MLDVRTFREGLYESLRRIRHPRMYQTERGFQGALVAELSAMRDALGIPTAEFLVEQEYQKRFGDHGINIRPDLVIHVPYDPARHGNRRQDNFVVFELTLRADVREAQDAYANVATMLGALNYDIGVFINIDSRERHVAEIPGMSLSACWLLL